MNSEPVYRLRIIDGGVSLPRMIDVRYVNLDTAYEILSNFVHSFDGIRRVDGCIIDANTEDDVNFVSSVMSGDVGWNGKTAIEVVNNARYVANEIIEQRSNLQNDAKENVRSLLRLTVGQEVVTENYLGHLQYENFSGVNVLESIQGLRLDNNNNIILACFLDYEDDDTPVVNDWNPETGYFVFNGNNNGIVVDWVSVLDGLVEYLQNNPKKVRLY